MTSFVETKIYSVSWQLAELIDDLRLKLQDWLGHTILSNLSILHLA